MLILLLFSVMHDVKGGTRCQYLVLETEEGVATLSLESLTLTISNGEITAVNNTETRHFTLSAIKKFYFSENDATGVQSVLTEQECESEKELFDMQGRKLSHLSKGVNLVRINGKVQKIIIR